MTQEDQIIPLIKTISPIQARKWLAENPRNRRIKQNRVDELADAIRRGEWHFDGSPIRFSTSGRLLDGQHRLLAISEAGLPVKALIVKNLPEEVQRVMDTGARRSFADNLQIDGESNSNVLGSATSILWRYENDAFGRKGFRRHPTYDQLYDVLGRYTELRRSVSAANALKRIRMPKAWTAAARTIFLDIHVEDTDFFFSELDSGANMAHTDPIFKLRETLNDNASSRTRRYSGEHLFALTIKAWNSFRKGEEVRQLSFRAGGAAPEVFPRPI